MLVQINTGGSYREVAHLLHDEGLQFLSGATFVIGFEKSTCFSILFGLSLGFILTSLLEGLKLIEVDLDTSPRTFLFVTFLHHTLIHCDTRHLVYC